MSELCHACGCGTLVLKHGTYVHAWPESVSARPTKFKDSAWLECDSCGEELLPASLLRRIEARRYEVEGLLKPEEIKAIRGNRSQVEMARFIGVGDKTYSRWENGSSIQTKAMDTLIRVAALLPEVFVEVERMRGEGVRPSIPSYQSKVSICRRTFVPGRFVESVARVSRPASTTFAVYGGSLRGSPLSWGKGHVPEKPVKDESGSGKLPAAA